MIRLMDVQSQSEMEARGLTLPDEIWVAFQPADFYRLVDMARELAEFGADFQKVKKRVELAVALEGIEKMANDRFKEIAALYGGE